MFFGIDHAARQRLPSRFSVNARLAAAGASSTRRGDGDFCSPGVRGVLRFGVGYGRFSTMQCGSWIGRA